MSARKQHQGFLLCVRNRGYSASLEVRKIYRRLADSAAQKRGYVRVVDESGEDYVFPQDLFVSIEVPVLARRAFARAT